MSDFLSNLIARGFTDAPVIQPRLPSLFEFSDQPQSSARAIGVLETIAPADVPASDPKIPPMKEIATEKPTESGSKGRTEVDLSKPESAVGQQKMIPQNVPPWNPNISRLGEIAPEEPTANVNVSEGRAEVDLQKPESAVRQREVIPQTRRATEQTTERSNLEIETNQVIVPVASFRAEEKDSEETERLAQAFSEPRPLHSRRRKDFSSIEPRSSASPPIIRVTIGRVEVRAVHPPAPTPKTAKPTPQKVSLEDYLHKRERRSR
jgi:hypothetical protein